ncbi:MAG TPA: hypothetical protein PLJ04_03630 [Candidatus Saccharibacteria bacterium]|jgi:hypothetical protein|nr:hypothetical protein [Patescibacteria group bacterium]HPR10646.1 hypothetical protein [Candidatus Saccharibacteria bacterium]
MAGSYPDVPGYRFAYDVDGTTVVKYGISGGAISTLSNGDMATLNHDQSNPGWWDYLAGDHQYIVHIFPEVRTITGYTISVRAGYMPSGGRIMETSTDTTNGQDGTWSVVANPYICIDGEFNPLSPLYRTSIQSVSFSNIKAIRFRVHGGMFAVHYYGSIATTESPGRLRVVDLSNNDIVAQLDFGNIAQRANSTKQFKVINNSSTLTANNITVSLNTISDASPTLIGQFQVSTDNIAFANAVNIGSLAPSASSGTLYVRDNIANNAQLGPWTTRIIAHPVSWS